jgi:hypothetical protein
LTATSGASQSGLDCGNFKLAMFSGNVFNDLNGNGHQDKGEPGLAAWTVELLDPSGNVAASTITNKSGNYTFSGIYPGTFTVAEIVKSGWHQTTVPTTYTVQAASGTNTSGLIFGDKLGAAPQVAVGGGSTNGASAITPISTTDLSTPSGYLRTGSSSVVVPGVSQPAPITVVYQDSSVDSKDQVAAAIPGLFDSKKKVTQEDLVTALAKSILGA